MVVTTKQRRARPSLTIRVTERIYNKIMDIAEQADCPVRDATEIFFNDLTATIAHQQAVIEDLQDENKRLEKEIKELEKEVVYWKKKNAKPD